MHQDVALRVVEREKAVLPQLQGGQRAQVVLLAQVDAPPHHADDPVPRVVDRRGEHDDGVALLLDGGEGGRDADPPCGHRLPEVIAEREVLADEVQVLRACGDHRARSGEEEEGVVEEDALALLVVQQALRPGRVVQQLGGDGIGECVQVDHELEDPVVDLGRHGVEQRPLLVGDALLELLLEVQKRGDGGDRHQEADQEENRERHFGLHTEKHAASDFLLLHSSLPDAKPKKTSGTVSAAGSDPGDAIIACNSNSVNR